ncbi:MAG: cation:proton antiporter [Anaeromyxobacteraceae bacterium]
MAVFELVIALLFGGALLSAWARRVNAPYPALLAVCGAALALFPSAPSIRLDPQLALTLFVAPVLLDAAFDSSPRDLRQNWSPIAGLVLGAVAVTIVAVAVVARWISPGLPWASAIALGAIVAPPDAAAATAVLRQLRPPHRLLVVLEGESLLNDASALLAYRLAVAAAVTGSFSGWSALPALALVLAGSVVLGLVLSRAARVLLTGIEDVPTAVIVQFISTFGVWMLAERLGLSGIITMVVYAVLVARWSAARTPARLRVPSYAVWDVAVFVLNVLAFIIVGLQLKPILARLDRPQLLAYLATAGAVCATVIVVRIGWVLSWAAVEGAARARRGGGPPADAPMKSAAVVAWCGMRGIVTLAAGLALPDRFPGRDLVLFTAFCVVLGTLVLQGGTLGPLLRALRLEDDGAVDGEVRLARAETARAALASMAHTDGEELSLLLRRKYEVRLLRARAAAGNRDGDGDGATGRDGDGAAAAYTAAVRRALAAERSALVDLRARGVIGDDAFHRVEEELDWAELNSDAMARRDEDRPPA